VTDSAAAAGCIETSPAGYETKVACEAMKPTIAKGKWELDDVWIVSGATMAPPAEVNSESVGAVLFEEDAIVGGKSDILCENVLGLGLAGVTTGGEVNSKLDLMEPSNS
jgi:hypothetical protein